MTKKIILAFLICTSYLVPGTAFSQATKYFHDRIDTTIYATTTGTNTYTGTNTDPNFNVAGYLRGLLVTTFIVNGNTGACTYQLVTRTATLSAVAIRKQNGAALTSGDIPDSSAVMLLYYGSFWRLVGIHAVPSSAWALTGNSGTTAGTNFIGTTDSVDFVFKTNNRERGRFNRNGGSLTLGATSVTQGKLNLKGITSGSVVVTSAAASGSWTLTLPTDDGTASQFLQTDGNGVTSWQTVASNDWALNGNTVGSEKWIGTADAFAFPIRTNNTEWARFLTTGEFGIGLTVPTAKLHIKGAGNTSTTFSIKTQNSSSTDIFNVRDDGYISAGLAGGNLTIGLNSFLATGGFTTVFGVGSSTPNASSYNCIFGAGAFNSANGGSGENSGFGYGTLFRVTSGAFNTGIGSGAIDFITTGSRNTAVGRGSGTLLATTSSDNTFIGNAAGGGVSHTSSFSTLLGSMTGQAAHGDACVFLGYKAGQYETAANKLFIDNQDRSTEATARTTSLIYGIFDASVANQRFAVNGIIQPGNAQTTTASSTSGDCTFSEPFGGTAYKKVVIYINASTGTTSYTFPVAFTNTPGIVITSAVAAAVVTALSTTAVTITGAATTGYIFLEGY